MPRPKRRAPSHDRSGMDRMAGAAPPRHSRQSREDPIDRNPIEPLDASFGQYVGLRDFVPLAYARLDGHGVVKEISPAACELIGVSASHVVERPFLVFVTKDSRSLFLDHMRRCRREEGLVETELSLRKRDGTVVAIRLSSRRFIVESASGCWTLLTDVTEEQRIENVQRQAERDRRQAVSGEQTARASNDAKDRFLAMLSHELRTPLTPALFAARRLLEQDLPEPIRQLVTIISRNVEMEARLIDDLLDVTRIARGGFELNVAVLDVHDLLREVLDVCAHDLMVPAGSSVRLSLNAGLHVVRGDAGRLRQVFRNVLINAQTFSTGGRIDVQTTNDETGALRVTIRDQGVGMDDDTLSKLFEPFEHRRAKSSRGGLGLGLAICKGIIDAHGGRISARSQGTGSGSTFEIELGTLEYAVPDAPVSSPPTAPDSQPSSVARRILLVEDDPDTAEMLSLVLKSDGHQVAVAGTLRDAIGHSHSRWDVVISDLSLPDGSGLDLPRHILDGGMRPRLIALSGYGTEQDVSDSARAGFDDHLVKPLDLDRLRAALSK